MEKKSKVRTFIGFAIRSGKFRIGANSIATLKKVCLMIVCKTASENTKKEAQKKSRKFGCKLLITESETLSELTHRENAKVMAITDEKLSQAIIDNVEEQFILVE